MRSLGAVLFQVIILSGGLVQARAAAQTANCQIAVTPAATLLLPYFEVDLAALPSEARLTVFNVTNTSPHPQIARVTLWTDRAFPVLSFNLYLTGYDIQPINLRDLLLRGMVPAGVGKEGNYSAPNGSNLRHTPGAIAECQRMSGQLPPNLSHEVRSLLTTGRAMHLACPASGGHAQVGSNHGPNTAIGYATVDVVAACSAAMPNTPEYYTRDLLYDNVLIGESIFIDPKGEKNGFAGAAPMVHIRAVPEGGAAGEPIETALPYTFYDRFTPPFARRMDRRQPLPSQFASRWIEGGETNFRTQLTVWRESASAANPSCDSYSAAAMPVTEIVRLDERENATAFDVQAAAMSGLPPASRISSNAGVFPPLRGEDRGGWLFLDLSNGGSAAYSMQGVAGARRASQNWVTTSMFAEGRYGVEVTAASLANGCVAPSPRGSQIAPRSSRR